MSYFRQIHTLIWKDGDFLELDPDEKLLFIYFFSNENTTLSGLYKIPLKVISFETNLTVEFIKDALEKFEQLEKIYYREGYVFVKNFQRYNRGGEKVAIAIQNEIKNLEDCEIKKIYMDYYHPEIGYEYPIHTSSLRRVKKSKEKEREEEGNFDDDKISEFTLYETIEDSDIAVIYMSVTGNMGFPTKTSEREAVLESIREISSRKKDETIAYLKPFWKDWRERKYSRMNPGWLDWALAGEIPERKQNGHSAKTVPKTNQTQYTPEQLLAALEEK